MKKAYISITNAAPVRSGAKITAAQSTLSGVDNALPSGKDRFIIQSNGKPLGPLSATRNKTVIFEFELADTRYITCVQVSIVYIVRGQEFTQTCSTHTTGEEVYKEPLDFPFLIPNPQSAGLQSVELAVAVRAAAPSTADTPSAQSGKESPKSKPK